MSPWWLKPAADAPEEDGKGRAPRADDKNKSAAVEAPPPAEVSAAPDAAAAPRAEAQAVEAPAPAGDDSAAPASAATAVASTGSSSGQAKNSASDAEEKPSRSSRGRRRRTPVKVAEVLTAVADDEVEEAEAQSEPPAEDAPKSKPARKRPARRSRKRGSSRETAASAAPEPAPAPAPAPAPRPGNASSSLESLAQEIVLSLPDGSPVAGPEPRLAIFCDLENIALGVRDSEVTKFDINLVLARLLEKGKVIMKKAYADWDRYSEFKRTFHEAAIELIDIPQKRYSGKNSADIKMVVDAMELSYTNEHIDTFIMLSGDSDFSPLVSKLRENNKHVIGVGLKNSSSSLLVSNCDEFIYYEDVWRDNQKPKAKKKKTKSSKADEAFDLMSDSIKALMRENKDVLWGSMIKQTMQRKRPSFNEGYYGYSTFSELLEDAERNGLVKLKKDGRSGTYVVTGLTGG